MNETLIRRFHEIVGENNCTWQAPMSRYTTFRIGGPADLLIDPETDEQVREILAICRQERIPYFVLGNGSNLLVSDAGYRGVIIRLDSNFRSMSVDGCRIFAKAGVLLSRIAAAAKGASLTGFEFASGIPGTFGGACMMNAGAYGGEMKDVLEEVTILNEALDIVTVPADQLELGYRHSRMMDNGWIVLSGSIVLEEGDPEKIEARMEELKIARTSKQPLEFPSAGSTFKRPEGYFAGKLIMDAGLAGFTVGGAQVSEKHCGFVINRGGATAADVCTLIHDVQRIVQEKYGVVLEPEVRFLGFDDPAATG